MNQLKTLLASFTGGNTSALGKALMAPIFIVMVLSMMVLPLPSFALDLLFTFNIAMSLMVMMVERDVRLSDILYELQHRVGRAADQKYSEGPK